MKDQKQNRLNRTPIASDDVKLSDADLDVLADWVRRLDGLGEEFGEEFGERLIVTSEFDRENEESVRFGGSAESLAAQLPQTWGELLRLGSINQKRAAQLMGYRSTKTIQRLLDAKKLTRTSKNRVACNDLLRNELRKIHGLNILR